MKIEIINEGLFQNDLENLVKPLISIYEYESKIQDDSVVIAFFVKNKDAADDLSIFLERTSITEILDTEASSAPDEDGDYLVFVEMTNNIDAKIVLKLLTIVNYLSKNKEWVFEGYKLPRTYKADEKNLALFFDAIKEKKI